MNKTNKRQRTKMDVIRELGELESQTSENREKGIRNSTEIVKRIAQLRHEIKRFDTVPAKGRDANAIKEYWKRQAEEARKKQLAEARKEKRRIAEAKKRLKKDKNFTKQVAEELSIKELEALLKKKKGK